MWIQVSNLLGLIPKSPHNS